ncbi:hypothetical protein C8R45DRAFT_833135 [Mycena sanguinolenta]|nr:hypothetical protein C8R45DRAFT_833135 [Mycena sanguinolenta]
MATQSTGPTLRAVTSDASIVPVDNSTIPASGDSLSPPGSPSLGPSLDTTSPTSLDTLDGTTSPTIPDTSDGAADPTTPLDTTSPTSPTLDTLDGTTPSIVPDTSDGATAPTTPTSPTSPTLDTLDGSASPTIPDTSDGGAGPTLPDIAAGSTALTDFVQSGKLDHLFGVKLAADLYTFNGELPAGLTLPVDGAVPVCQLAIVNGDDLLLSTILPQLAGTEFVRMPFKQMPVLQQNCDIDPSKPAGLHMNGDVVFDSSFGALHDVLSTVLGIQNPTLHVQSNFGTASSAFNKALTRSSFTLSGSFPELVIKPCVELSLSAITVEIIGSEIVPDPSDPAAQKKMSYEFHVTGAMHLGLDHLLDLTFDISDNGGTMLALTATQAAPWDGAFGVKGLTLQAFTLHTTLDAKKLMDTFKFDVTASLAAGGTVGTLSGVYNADKTFSVSANFTNLGTAGLSDLYQHIHGTPLATPKLNVQVGAATLTIASGTGFTLNIQDLSVEHYTGFDAEVDFSSTGAVVKVGLTSSGSEETPLKFGEIELDKAYIQITFAPKATNVILGGELRWESFTLDAGVHIYRVSSPNNQSDNSLHWTVFANFVTAADADQGLPLSTLIHELKGTFLGDITLEDAAFIAASQDDPEFGSFNTTNFPIQQGIQICAVLGLIKPLSDIMRVQDQPKLTLSAAWSKASGFSLDILLPTPMQLPLGHGIITDPFSLQIRTTSTLPTVIPPTIQLNAGLQLRTANDPDPLHFTFSLALNATDIQATGELSGYWSDPFGLSPQVRIGPHVALVLGISFEDAMPIPFGFAGDLQIGRAVAHLAFEVGPTPSQDLLFAEILELHIIDLIELIGDLIQKKIPNIPDFMVFKDIKFYICPAGAQMGDVVYQRGCQFYADMEIFGHEAEVNVQIDGKSLTASSSLDNFVLGPLHVTCIDGPKATSSVVISPEKQAGSFQGKITLYDLVVVLDLQLEFKPDPFFHFHFELDFTAHLQFTVDANMVGKMDNIHDMSGLSFHLVAMMQQDILDYAAQAVNTQFTQAIQAEKSDIDEQKAKVDKAKKQVDDAMKQQQAKVDTAYKAWQTKSDTVNKQFKATTDTYNAQVKLLQGQLDAAKAKYATDLANAQHQLNCAKADSASKVQAAQTQLAKTQNDCAAKLAAAQKNLDDATKDMNARFGDAEKKVDGAQAKVNDLQHQIDDLDGKIHRSNRLSALPLKAKKGAIMATMKVAQGVLDAVTGVLKSQNFIAARGVMQVAQATLTTTKSAGQAAISSAQAATTAANDLAKKAVDAASQTLSKVSVVGPAAIDMASKSLDAYKKASVATLSAAQASVDALSKSGEWLAYQSAQAGLKAANSSTHELDLANGALQVAEQGEAGLLHAADYIASHSLTLVDIHYIRIECDFDKAAKGADFAANVQGSIAGKAFKIDVDYDPRKVADFLNNLFQKCALLFLLLNSAHHKRRILAEIKDGLPH